MGEAEIMDERALQAVDRMDEISESLAVHPPKGNPKQFTRDGVTFYRAPDGHYYTVPDEDRHPWETYGLTESQWNHEGTDGTTLGEAIMEAEDDPRNEGEKVVFKYWSKDKGERVPIAYMEDPKHPENRHPIWDTPAKPDKIIKPKDEYIVHNGVTFSEKDGNEMALKQYDVLWLDLTEPQKKDVIANLLFVNKAHRAKQNPDETDRIPHQTAGGRADTRYNRAYEEAPSHGIFGAKEKAEFAERKSKTQAGEDVQYKKNVRAWVRASKDALRSGNDYRIAETAREVPYTPPGSEGITEHEGISQHIAQANVAGQHIEQSLGRGKNKEAKEHEHEFASIVDTIDAQTKSWPE